MDDCIFCKIINGEIPSSTVYEDEIVKVFLDINPTTNGDSLIVPKKHYKDIRDIDNKTVDHMNNVVRNLYPIYQKKLHCDGLTIAYNADYGQDIKHFHMHFIPRYKDDGVQHIKNEKHLKRVDEVAKILNK